MEKTYKYRALINHSRQNNELGWLRRALKACRATISSKPK